MGIGIWKGARDLENERERESKRGLIEGVSLEGEVQGG